MVSLHNIRWTRMTCLALRGLACLYANAGLCHCLFYHPNRDCLLCFRIDTLLGYECGDLLPKLGEFMVSFCFADLDFPFLQNLDRALMGDVDVSCGVTNLFHDVVCVHLTKCLPQIVMLGNLTLGDICKDVIYLKDVV